MATALDLLAQTSADVPATPRLNGAGLPPALAGRAAVLGGCAAALEMLGDRGASELPGDIGRIQYSSTGEHALDSDLFRLADAADATPERHAASSLPLHTLTGGGSVGIAGDKHSDTAGNAAQYNGANFARSRTTCLASTNVSGTA